ncbi:hypothetical protein LEP1GSC127_4673 [Leptospira kirschneri str. 200801925]|nr:hypothetical protein LEP1GSC127_4673 [Leptospira kirschneri str. 200801925]
MYFYIIRSRGYVSERKCAKITSGPDRLMNSNLLDSVNFD